MIETENLTMTIRIAATPAEVFPFFVEPSLFVQWLGTRADLNPEPGGVFALDIDDTLVRGNYLAVEPPDRVVFTWGISGSEALPAGSTTVEIILKADDDETVVELIHHNLPSDQRSSHEEGWTACLNGLRQTAGSNRTLPPSKVG